jgi:hypothetical protein
VASATPTASAASPGTAGRRFDGPADPGVPSDAEVPASAWRFGRPRGWTTTAYYKREASLYLETQDEVRGGRLYAHEQTAALTRGRLDQETYLAGAFQVKWQDEVDITVGAERYPAKLAFGRGKSMDHPSQARQVLRLVVRGGDTTLLAIGIWKDDDAATAADIETSVRGLMRASPQDAAPSGW